MMPSEQNLRVLALAGIFQSASLIKQLAKTGRVDIPSFNACIHTIFKLNPRDTLDIYHDPGSFGLGFQEIIHLFENNKKPKDAEIARYTFSLIHLERKLSDNKTMLNQIRTGLERAATQAQHFHPTHENVLANLASIYTDTLSTFGFKVYISGEPLYLNQPQVMNKVRALLLAGIRSAVLWHQLGGRRWQLLFTRAAIIQSSKQWLEHYVHADVT